MAQHDSKLYKLTTPYAVEFFDNGTSMALLNRNYKPIGTTPQQQNEFFNYRDYAFKLEKPATLKLLNALSIHTQWQDMNFIERRVYLYASCTEGALTGAKEWDKYQDKLRLVYSLAQSGSDFKWGM